MASTPPPSAAEHAADLAVQALIAIVGFLIHFLYALGGASVEFGRGFNDRMRQGPDHGGFTGPVGSNAPDATGFIHGRAAAAAAPTLVDHVPHGTPAMAAPAYQSGVKGETCVTEPCSTAPGNRAAARSSARFQEPDPAYVTMMEPNGTDDSWYVITAGIRVGVFQGWDQVAPHVVGVRGNVFHRCRNRAVALRDYNAALAASLVFVLQP